LMIASLVSAIVERTTLDPMKPAPHVATSIFFAVMSSDASEFYLSKRRGFPASVKLRWCCRSRNTADRTNIQIRESLHRFCVCSHNSNWWSVRDCPAPPSPHLLHGAVWRIRSRQGVRRSRRSPPCDRASSFREARRAVRSRELAQVAAQVRIADQALECRGERVRVLLRHDQRRGLVAGEF